MTTNSSDPLRALANRWVLKARDHARQSKSTGDERLSAYHRGIAETYHKAALDLADELQSGGNRASAPTSQSAASTGALPDTKPMVAPTDDEPAAIPISYVAVPVKEVIMMLEYAGISARDVNMHKDNVYTAIFSRWQPFSDEERLKMMRGADRRLVVLANGKLRDTGDPYVDFAFRELP